MPAPSVHRIVVRPALKNVLVQSLTGGICLVAGFGVMIVAILRPPMEGRTMALVVGSIFGLIGLLICLTLTRVLRTRTYTFTESALEGVDAAGRSFRLPWHDLEGITIDSSQPAGYWHYLRVRRYQSRVHAYLRITVRPGAELTGTAAVWSKWTEIRLPFWNRHELVHSFAYGCRTFAGPKFQGVKVS